MRPGVLTLPWPGLKAYCRQSPSAMSQLLMTRRGTPSISPVQSRLAPQGPLLRPSQADISSLIRFHKLLEAFNGNFLCNIATVASSNILICCLVYHFRLIILTYSFTYVSHCVYTVSMSPYQCRTPNQSSSFQ